MYVVKTRSWAFYFPCPIPLYAAKEQSSPVAIESAMNRKTIICRPRPRKAERVIRVHRRPDGHGAEKCEDRKPRKQLPSAD
jgi:hypothetical protein